MATTVKVVHAGGVAWRKSTNFRDLNREKHGPAHGTQLCGHMVTGDVEYLQFAEPNQSQLYLPLRAPNGMLLCSRLQAALTADLHRVRREELSPHSHDPPAAPPRQGSGEQSGRVSHRACRQR